MMAKTGGSFYSPIGETCNETGGLMTIGGYGVISDGFYSPIGETCNETASPGQAQAVFRIVSIRPSARHVTKQRRWNLG